MSWFWWQTDGSSKGSSMKTGDIVWFMEKPYRVGTCMTSNGVELIELAHPLRGLWVSRDEVHAVSAQDRSLRLKTWA